MNRVQVAADAHDAVGAARELNSFAADVAAAHTAGRLAAADYAALQAGIGRTRARIAEVTPPPAAPTPVAPVEPQPVVPVTGDGPGNGKGNGKAKNKGKGNGGD